EVSLLRPQPSVERTQLGGGEELRGRRAPALPLAEGPHEALRAELLSPLDQPVQGRAREVAPAGIERLHDPAVVDRGPEYLELALAQLVGDVDELQREPDGRPVRPVAVERLGVGDSWDGQLDPGPVDGLEHMSQHPLVDVDYVLDPDERHLQVELGEVELAIGALVLVSEASNDLVVALEAGD